METLFPILEFLISTKLPIFDFFPIFVFGLNLALGPICEFSSIVTSSKYELLLIIEPFFIIVFSLIVTLLSIVTVGSILVS